VRCSAYKNECSSVILQWFGQSERKDNRDFFEKFMSTGMQET